jgi:hypothetical protein
MLVKGKKVHKPAPYLASKRAAYEPGDEQVGAYSTSSAFG